MDTESLQLEEGMRLGADLIKRRRLLSFPVCAQRKGHGKTQREGGHLPAQERGLPSNRACRHLGLGLFVSRIKENKLLFFNSPRPWYSVVAAGADQYLP